MARIIAAPEESVIAEGEISLFLAGGITNCWNWQNDACERLRSVPNLVIFNPRRADYTSDVEGQIYWEWRHLRSAHAISFWFAAETVQPITLFELGRWTAADLPGEHTLNDDRLGRLNHKKLFVGVHEEYSRRLDIELQLRYQCPDQSIASSIPALVEEIQRWAAHRQGALT